MEYLPYTTTPPTGSAAAAGVGSPDQSRAASSHLPRLGNDQLVTLTSSATVAAADETTASSALTAVAATHVHHYYQQQQQQQQRAANDLMQITHNNGRNMPISYNTFLASQSLPTSPVPGNLRNPFLYQSFLPLQLPSATSPYTLDPNTAIRLLLQPANHGVEQASHHNPLQHLDRRYSHPPFLDGRTANPSQRPGPSHFSSFSPPPGQNDSSDEPRFS